MIDKNDDEIRKIFDAQSRSFLDRMERMPSHDEVAEYSNRFVAFVDILGFSNIVGEFAATSPNDIFHLIVDSYWFHSTSATVSFRLLSDSIIIVSHDDLASSFISVANAINNVRNSFLERGLLLRGAVSFGKHYDSHGICISPALISAYDMESRHAIFPRIICSPSVIDFVLPAVSKNPKGRSAIIGPYGYHVLRDQLPISDFDGLMAIEFLPDTLEAYFLRTGHHHDPFYVPTDEQLKHFREVGPQLLSRWRAGLVLAQKRCKEERHKEKVNYIIGKWNRYIESFTALSESEKRAYLM